MISKDAERIVKLPFAHHPLFAQQVRDLAHDPKMTFSEAVDVLCAEMKAKGVTVLDIEMCQPGTAFKVPFAETHIAPGGDFQQSVAGHVRQLLGASG